MLALTLAILSHVSGRSGSMNCQDGGAAEVRVATSPLQAPNGAQVALQVSSADDHAKRTHRCHAEYELSVTPHPGLAAVSIDLLRTDAAWGRRLFVHLDGVSADGTRILGLLQEEGRDAFTAVLESDGTADKVRLMLLPRAFGAQRGCGHRMRVVATSGHGVVLESECEAGSRWLVQPVEGSLPRHLWGPDMGWNGEDLCVATVRRVRVADAVLPLQSLEAPSAAVEGAGR